MQLFVEHEPKQLLSFLKQTHFWDHNKTLSLCDSRDTALFDPLVYVQERKQDMCGAMHTILENLQDIPQTIEFIRRHSLHHADDELWAILITYPEKKKVVALIAGTDQEDIEGIGLITNAVADCGLCGQNVLKKNPINLTKILLKFHHLTPLCTQHMSKIIQNIISISFYCSKHVFMSIPHGI